MIKKLSIVLLYAVCCYSMESFSGETNVTELGLVDNTIERDIFDSQVELEVIPTKAVVLEKKIASNKNLPADFQETVNSKFDEVDSRYSVVAEQVTKVDEDITRVNQDLLNLKASQFTTTQELSNLKDSQNLSQQFRSNTVTDIQELKERCRKLEVLVADNKKREAKHLILTGCCITALAFLAYEVWLYNSKMSKPDEKK